MWEGEAESQSMLLARCRRFDNIFMEFQVLSMMLDRMTSMRPRRSVTTR